MADAIFCIGFLHHLTEDDIAVAISEVARILNPGGSLLISEPRRVAANSVPLEIADWNSRSIACRLGYSHSVNTVPEEEPIDDEDVLVMIRENGMVVDHQYWHWEIFPHEIPVSKEESSLILDMHRRHGSTGNCITVVARKRF